MRVPRGRAMVFPLAVPKSCDKYPLKLAIFYRKGRKVALYGPNIQISGAGGGVDVTVS